VGNQNCVAFASDQKYEQITAENLHYHCDTQCIGTDGSARALNKSLYSRRAPERPFSARLAGPIENKPCDQQNVERNASNLASIERACASSP
jgi:hypothetical protein